MVICCPCWELVCLLCLRVMNVVRSCFAHHNTLVSSIAWCGVMYGRYNSPIGRNSDYSCSVEDLLCRSFVRGTVELWLRKRVTADKVRTAGLLQECTMFRDGLVRLPDAFTVHCSLFAFAFCDFTDIACYLCTCSLLSSFLFLFLYSVYDLYNK